MSGTEAPPPGGGGGAPLGRHFATPTRGTGLGGEAPPPGGRHLPPWTNWLEASTRKREVDSQRRAGNGSTASRKLGGVFSTHMTSGGRFSDDLLKSLWKYATFDFKAKLSALRSENLQGLQGLISSDGSLGLADSGEEHEQQRRRDKVRRLGDGLLVAADLSYLQLLVGVSTIAEVTPTKLAQEAMCVVYEVLTGHKSTEDRRPRGTGDRCAV